MSTPLGNDPDRRTAPDIELSDEHDTVRRMPPTSGDGVLARSDVQARLPAQDLERARRFYAEKLGLHPVEERPGGLRYRCGSTLFALFASAGTPSGRHTQMGWKVGG